MDKKRPNRPKAKKSHQCETDPQLCELIRSALAGDRVATDALLLKVRRWLRYQAADAGLKGADADDLVGEVLPDVWFRLADYDASRSSFRSWVEMLGLDGIRAVYTLRNAASIPRRVRARFREAKEQPFVSLDEQREDGSAKYDVPVEGGTSKVSQDEVRAIVSGILAGMATPYRDVLIWRFGLDGEEPMGVQEIAEECGVSHQAISMRLEKALGAVGKSPFVSELISR